MGSRTAGMDVRFPRFDNHVWKDGFVCAAGHSTSGGQDAKRDNGENTEEPREVHVYAS